MGNYFHTCQYCGSNLDPGEICDCTSQSVKKAEVSTATETKRDIYKGTQKRLFRKIG